MSNKAERKREGGGGRMREGGGRGGGSCSAALETGKYLGGKSAAEEADGSAQWLSKHPNVPAP